jgi:hypothetical protein
MMDRRTLLLGGAAWAFSPALARPDTRRSGPDLRLSAVHAVIRPDLIRGVIEVYNPGDAPVVLVDRWNSFGAYQWTIRVDGRWLAANPISAWNENGPSETVLAPGETRQARFFVVLDGPAHDFPVEYDWPFAPAALQQSAPFTEATSLLVRWDSTAAAPRPAGVFPASQPRRAQGAARIASRLIDAVPHPPNPLP